MRGEERCVACEDRRPATPPARRRAAEIEQRLERARGDSERSRVRESSKGLWRVERGQLTSVYVDRRRRVAHTHRAALATTRSREAAYPWSDPVFLVSPVPAVRQARDLDSRVMGVTTVLHGLCTV